MYNVTSESQMALFTNLMNAVIPNLLVSTPKEFFAASLKPKTSTHIFIHCAIKPLSNRKEMTRKIKMGCPIKNHIGG